MAAAIQLSPVPRSARPGDPAFRALPEEPRAIVLVWPDYSGGNPYQSLLYATNAFGAAYHFAPIETAIALLEGNVVDVPVVFHLHWLNWLLKDIRRGGIAFRLVTDFIAKLHRFKALGGILIWTIHNEISHESQFREEERALSAEICRLADAIHVHDRGSLDEITSFPIPLHKVVEVPHGHYCGAYPDTVSRADARALFNYSEEEEVCLFFGMVRRYKGVEELVSAFRTLLKERPALRLLLVGRMLYDPFEESGATLTPEERRAIRIHGGHIDDARIQTFFRAADFAVFPYRRVLTSGSVMLSLSFGVPTAASDVAMTRSVLRPAGLGTTIPEPGTAEQVAGALRELARRRKDAGPGIPPEDLARFRERFRWRDISVEVIGPLVESHAAPRRARAWPSFRGRPLRPETPVEEYAAVVQADIFCAETFRTRYPLACAASRDPAAAYLEQARETGLQPAAGFDPVFYRTFFEDAAASDLDPFVHYLKFGAAWSRPANRIEQEKQLETCRAGLGGTAGLARGIHVFVLPTRSPAAAERRAEMLRRALGWTDDVTVHVIAPGENAPVRVGEPGADGAADGRLVLHGDEARGRDPLHEALRIARGLAPDTVAVFLDPEAAAEGRLPAPGDIVRAFPRAPQPFVFLPGPDDPNGLVMALTCGLIAGLLPAHAPLVPDGLPALMALRARQACPALPILVPPSAATPFGLPRSAEWLLATAGIARTVGSLADVHGKALRDGSDTRALAQLFDVSDALIDGASGAGLRRTLTRETVRARVAFLGLRSPDDGVGWLFDCLSGTTERIAGPGDAVVFLCVRNDQVFLPAFIEHYRGIGARHLVIVDDRSDRPYADEIAADDVTVMQPVRGRFLSAKTLWLETLIQHFATPDGWVLTVDADEFFDPPEGFAGLAELSRALEEEGRNYLPCVLVDMLPAVGAAPPDGSLSGNFVDLLDHICWDTRAPAGSYASDKTVRWGFGSYARLSWQIDARFHMFGVTESLRKISFFRSRRSIHLNQGFHALLDPTGENFLTEQAWESGPVGRVRHYKYAKFISKEWRSGPGDFAGRYFEGTARNIARIVEMDPAEILKQARSMPTIPYAKADFAGLIDDIRRSSGLSAFRR